MYDDARGAKARSDNGHEYDAWMFQVSAKDEGGVLDPDPHTQCLEGVLEGRSIVKSVIAFNCCIRFKGRLTIYMHLNMSTSCFGMQC